MVALISTIFAACKHDNLEVPDASKTFRLAGDFIRNNYDLTMFAAAIDYAGMREELNSAGPYTVFAPNNTAFAQLGITRASDFAGMDKDSLRNMLHYHMLGRRLIKTDVPANNLDSRYASLYEGREPFFTYVAYGSAGPAFPVGDLYINGAFAVKSDVALQNGMLHVIDKVMKYTPGTVQDWLNKRSEYSVFVAALKKFGYWDQLAFEGTCTVYAPDNAALEKGGITAEWVQNVNVNEYLGARLFGIYIIPGRRFFATDFVAAGRLYANGGFAGFIPNDTYKFALKGEKDTYRQLPSTVTITFTRPATPEQPWDQAVRDITGNIAGRIDNLTDNGLVHHLPNFPVLPNEAEKN
ncbi:fasciclin domain-containing protein [Chitinophaga sedimenti]|uniref:fasciclin domain-containing protein n=1 Tax=Chitinophaga sedimenti TaxID=2033606 RepID=UPI002004B65F|nr:fasciclin domain-containing protein [Chitinophaga sedimenti]MCK7554181.1 fasciclin domain-containing protein [Chitinophaga sedimenti]